MASVRALGLAENENGVPLIARGLTNHRKGALSVEGRPEVRIDAAEMCVQVAHTAEDDRFGLVDPWDRAFAEQRRDAPQRRWADSAAV